MELSEAEKYSQGVKSTFGSILKTEINLLLATSPIMRIPIVGGIVRNYISKILDKVLESGRLYFFFKFIDMRVADQKGEYTNAVLNYENAKLTGDENEIERTKKIMLDKFDNFVRFNQL